MLPRIYKIDEPWGRRLATSERPRGGDWLADEVAGWRSGGIDVVVSLLEDHEVAEFDLEPQPALCAEHGIAFHRLPIPDRSVPESRERLVAFADELADGLDRRETTLIHCRQGIGRASLLAATLMVRHGIRPAEAWKRITQARGRPVPDTQIQREWVKNIAPR